MEKMFKHKINSMPVFESKDRRTLVGTLTREDFGKAYCVSMEELMIE
jgi:CBS-domain-containing membrane protein